MIGEMTPRQKDRRERILNSAVVNFSVYGFTKADIGQIANDAGVGKGTIYSYFKSKADLYLKTIEYKLDESFMEVRKRLDAIKDPLEYVKMYISVSVDYLKQDTDSIKILMHSNAVFIDNIIDVVGKVRNKYLNYHSEKLKEGIESGVLSGFNSHIVARLIDSSIIALMYENCRTSKYSDEEIKETLTQTILHGLCA